MPAGCLFPKNWAKQLSLGQDQHNRWFLAFTEQDPPVTLREPGHS